MNKDHVFASIPVDAAEIWRTPPVFHFISEGSACLQELSGCF